MLLRLRYNMRWHSTSNHVATELLNVLIRHFRPVRTAHLDGLAIKVSMLLSGLKNFVIRGNTFELHRGIPPR
jgi:hypothetical protein